MATEKTKEYDLTFVAPERRDEVRRKLVAIDNYLENPSQRAADAGAAALGLRRRQFYFIVGLWRKTRRPEDLTRARQVRRQSTRFPIEMQDILRHATAELPAGSARQVWLRAGELARDLDMEMVSEPTARRFINAVRREATVVSSQESGLEIVHCVLELSVPTVAGERTLPVATFVVDLSTRHVIGASLNLEINAAGVASALLDALRHTPEVVELSDPFAITMDTTSEPSWALLVAALDQARIRYMGRCRERMVGGARANELIGTRLVDFHLRPQLTRKAIHARRAAGPELSLKDAEALLQARIHAGAAGLSSLSRLTGTARAVLENSLKALVPGAAQGAAGVG